MEKPEALRLADWLEDQYDPTYNQEQAAAELRRLHDENKILHQFHHDANLEYTRILVQRDALLEALKYHQEQTRPIQRTLDAIKAVEEGK